MSLESDGTWTAACDGRTESDARFARLRLDNSGARPKLRTAIGMLRLESAHKSGEWLCVLIGPLALQPGGTKGSRSAAKVTLASESLLEPSTRTSSPGPVLLRSGTATGTNALASGALESGLR